MEIPITGQRISVTAGDYLVELSTTEGFELQIEGDLESEHGGRRTVSLAAGDGSRANLEAVLRGSITTATVDPAGLLQVDLDSAGRLVVPPDDEYEAWTLVGTSCGRGLAARTRTAGRDPACPS